MHFHVRWPDQRVTRCYSPSLVIHEYFQPGQSYHMNDFLQRAREALEIASERVREKYGFACSQAMDQLAEIEEIALDFQSQTDAQIAVTKFE